MKQLKRWTAVLLALLLLCGAVPVTSMAAPEPGPGGVPVFYGTLVDSGTCGDNVNWSFYDAGYLLISGTGTMADYTTSNKAPWDGYKEDIETAVIEDGVTSIGNYAFYDCSSLESIEIPDGVTSIGDYAFDNCNALTSIELPDGVTSIGDYAFHWCSALESIELPDSLTSIGNAAFYGCYALTSIELPDSLTSIGHSAFYYCSSLESIELPDGVTSIGDAAFYSCGALTSIELPDGVTSIGNYAFYYCIALTSIELPDGVTSIGNYAFYYCSSLASIELPDSVTSIGASAFSRCTSLGNIYTCKTQAEWVSTVTTGTDWKPDTADLVYEAHETDSVTWTWAADKSSATASYTCVLCGEDVLMDATVENTYKDGYLVAVATVNASGSEFTDEQNIMPGGYCGGESGGKNLTWILDENGKLTISGTGVMSDYDLEDTPWYNNEDILTIEIGEGVTSVGRWAFFGCPAVETVRIANSVANIRTGAFSNCNSLQTINTCKTQAEWESTVTTGSDWKPDTADLACEAHETDSVTWTWAADKSSATASYTCSICGDDVTKDATVTNSYKDGYLVAVATVNASGSEFTDEQNLMPGGYCGGEGDGKNLTWILDENGKLTISGTGAMSDYNLEDTPWYNNNEDILTIEIGEGVTSVGRWAFCGCPAVETVRIANSVANIRTVAFADCNSLQTINTCKTQAEWENTVTTGSNWKPDTANLVYEAHETDSVTWTWAADKSSATASFECKYCGTAGEEEATVTNSYKDGYLVATATVTAFGSEFTDEQNLMPGGYCGGEGDGKNLTWSYNTTNKTLTISGTGSMADYSSSDKAPWFDYMSDIETAVIEDGVTSIGNYAFYYCRALTSIELPDGVTSIGNYAFYYCRALASIELPDGVTSIGDRVFYCCDALASIELPDSVTSIGNYAFFNCRALTSIELPDGVTSIGDHVFYSCLALTSIEIPDSVTSIGNYAFYYCSSLESIELPDGVTSIGDYAFYSCRALTSIHIPNDVTTIGQRAFYNCSELTSINTCKTQAEWESTVTTGTDWKPDTADLVYEAHETDSVTWTWAADKSSATASFECKYCGTAGEEEATVTTAVVDGKNIATATVTAFGAEFTDEQGAHVHNSIDFTPWEATDSLPPSSGSYYLTADVTLTAGWTAPSGITNLCLNGKTVTYAGTDKSSVMIVNSGSTLSIYDDTNTGKITGGTGTLNSGAYVGGGVFVNSGTLNLYGGNITENAPEYGGGVTVAYGLFNMYDGTISNNAANGGGGVYVRYEGSTFNLYGGSISANTAETDSGGGVTVKDGGFINMYDGSISGNTANLSGGGVCVNADSEFVMNGGSISDNSSTSSGAGGVAVGNSCTFSMFAGSISGNTASFSGGVHLSPGSILNMSGGSITGNSATSSSAGGVAVGDGCTFNMFAGSISDNTANISGGVHLAPGSTLNMSGGSITGNTAAYKAGGMAVRGTFNLSGDAEICGNVGGDLYIRQDEGAVINVTEPITNSNKIGVRMYCTSNAIDCGGVFTSGWNDVMGGVDPNDYFKPDLEGYEIRLTADNEAELVDLAVDAVINAINAIGTVEYTDESKGKIDAARDAYDALNDAQQADVTNYQTLLDAEAAYAALAGAVDDVIDLINAIGTVEYTDESKGKIDAARDAYDALNDAQQDDVTNYQTLLDAEAAYAALAGAVDDVIDLINAIGTVEYTDESKGKIDDARAAYTALNDAQQDDVTNYQTLLDAEAAYAALAGAVDDVIDLINAIGTVEYTAESKGKIDDARDAYDALNDAQQADVTNYQTLLDAEAAYAALAGAVTDTIAAINAIGTVEYTDESKGKIDDARDAYDALNDAQQADVTNYQTLLDAEAAYAALAGAVNDVIDLIDAIGTVEYTDESKGKIDDARNAYDALSDEQKAEVTNYQTLLDAEAAYAALEDAANRAAFEAEKEPAKDVADSKAKDGDSDACTQLIEKAKEEIDALEYDSNKSFAENKAAIQKILTRLDKKLAAQRDNDHGYRCGMCDFYEEWRSIPVIGWFVTFIHNFVHMASMIGNYT